MDYSIVSSSFSSSYSFNGYQISGLDSSLSCAQFSVQRFPIYGVLNANSSTWIVNPNNSVVALSSTISQVNVTDVNGNPVTMNGNVSSCITIDASLVSQYSDKTKWKYTPVKVLSTNGVYDQVSTTGISVLNQTESAVCFNSSSVGNFAAVIQRLTSASTSNPTSNPTTKSGSGKVGGMGLSLFVGFGLFFVD